MKAKSKSKAKKRYTINGLDEATARKIKVLAVLRGITIPRLITELVEAATTANSKKLAEMTAFIREHSWPEAIEPVLREHFWPTQTEGQ